MIAVEDVAFGSSSVRICRIIISAWIFLAIIQSEKCSAWITEDLYTKLVNQRNLELQSFDATVVECESHIDNVQL